MRESAVSADRSAVSSNSIVHALSHLEGKRLVASCTALELRYGAVLFQPGEVLKHVYFPTSGLVSLLTPASGAASVEVGLVGNEGMAGVSIILGVQVSPVLGLVQGRGSALRMKASVFRSALKQSPRLRRELNSYLYCLMAQITQTAACNRLHSVRQRLARWLLMTQDRMQSDKFYLTQEFLAQMLTVRREGVTTAAGSLRRDSLISYLRGNITVLDRLGLQRAACECYRAVNAICRHAYA
jgi:CRP-like cAMP-binding protein